MAHINAPYSMIDSHGKRASLLERIVSFLAHIAEANPRMREVERLNAKTDAELASMGLKREDIVRHVMRDMMYI